MPRALLSPLEVLEASSSIMSKFSLTPAERDLIEEEERRREAVRRALAIEDAEAEDDGGGIWDSVKSVGGKALGGALNVLDVGRAAVVATGEQLGHLAGDALRKDTGENFSPGQWLKDVKRRQGAGEVIEEHMADAPLWTKQALGGALDIAADPLNFVTLGTGKAAREALRQVGRLAGDDVARVAAKEGIDAADRLLAERFAAGLPEVTDVVPTPRPMGAPGGRGPQVIEEIEAASRARLAEKIGSIPNATDDLYRFVGLEPPAVAPTVRGLLKGAASPLAKLTPAEVAAKQLDVIARRGKGGLGFAGRSFGLGQATGEKLLQGARQSELGRLVRPLFVPTARIADELGAQVAEATDLAMHSSETARYLAKGGLRAEVKAGVELSDDEIAERLSTAGRTAAIKDLTKYAPSAVSDVERAGWKELVPGTWVPEVVHRTLEPMLYQAGPVLKVTDKLTAGLKRYTTLGILNAVPHVTRNIMSNHLFASMYGGLRDAPFTGRWREAHKARKAVRAATEAGETVFDADTLARYGLNEQAAKRAAAAVDQGAISPWHSGKYDDTGIFDETVLHESKDPIGTRRAAAINQWHEELSRTAVLFKHMDDGLAPELAAKRARDAMLDYSTAGLTPTERSVIQRLVFFYKFPRRAVPAALRFAFEMPGAAAAATEAGVGVAQGARNEYGEKIGLFMDTPLESAFGTLRDFVVSPADAAMEMVNPVLRAIMDKDERKWGDALPPVGALERFSEDPSRIIGTRFPGTPIPAFGFREGKDYEVERAMADEAEYAARRPGQAPTQHQLLLAAALANDVPRAVTLTDAELVAELRARKVDLGRVLVP